MNYGITANWRFPEKFALRFISGERTPSTRPALAQTATDDRRNIVAVLIGRLMYRDDLIRRMALHQEHREVGDAALVLKVYQHGGIAGIEKLEGEWAVIVWDGRQRQLILMRDALGSWPLFWRRDGGGIAISTKLATLRDGHSLNLEHLAEYLALPFPRAEVPSEHTAFHDIQRVEPGTIVQFAADGMARVRRYWNWAEAIEPNTETTLEANAERFAVLFRDSVQERMRHGPVAADLSGGMDSTAVVCIGRDLVNRGLSESPLHTTSIVFRRGSLASERAYIDLVANGGDPIHPHYIDGDDILDFEWFDDAIPDHDEPFNGLRVLATFRRFTESAGAIGAATILTGDGADDLLDPPPFHIADLLRRRRFIAALRETLAWAHGANRGFWTTFAPFGLGPLVPARLRGGIGNWLRGGIGRWPKLDGFTIPPWIQPGFARSFGLRDRAIAHARRYYGRPIGQCAELYNLESTVGNWSRWHLAAPRGINISHPFWDQRLVCFTLGIPQRLRSIPGRRKPLLQEAMRGVLPEPIRTRNDKRGFDDIYGRGLAKNLPALEQMARRSRIEEMGIVDVPKLIDVMRQAAMGTGDAMARARIDSTLALIAWLERPIASGSAQFNRACLTEAVEDAALVG